MIKEIPSSAKLPTYTDQLTTKNTEKIKNILSSTNLLSVTDQLTTKNTGMIKEPPSSTNLFNTNNTDEVREIPSSTKLSTYTDQLTIKNTDKTKKIHHLPTYQQRPTNLQIVKNLSTVIWEQKMLIKLPTQNYRMKFNYVRIY